ncbi:MAG TPA: class I SAM-dependent methyltransferase [Candidatus Aquicultor sp.]|jgi:2-polyprenyl-3-methyl-5-hydroxy-6-metoxy-1,4-benzoquinol methylase
MSGIDLNEDHQPIDHMQIDYLRLGYAEFYVQENQFDQQTLDDLADYYWANYGSFLPKDPEARILDVGCGGGQFLRCLEQKGYRSPIGVDISLNMVRLASTVARNSQVDLTEDTERYLKETGPYDAIVIDDVLEHIPKHQTIPFLLSVKEALRPGATLLIKVPNMGALFVGQSRYIDFTHEVGYTQESLHQVLKDIGYVDITLWAPIPPPPNCLTRSLRRALGNFRRAFLSAAIERTLVWAGYSVPKITSELLMAVARKPGQATD